MRIRVGKHGKGYQNTSVNNIADTERATNFVISQMAKYARDMINQDFKVNKSDAKALEDRLNRQLKTIFSAMKNLIVDSLIGGVSANSTTPAIINFHAFHTRLDQEFYGAQGWTFVGRHKGAGIVSGLNRRNRKSAGRATAKAVKKQTQASLSVSWPVLTPRALRRKKNDTYFKESGALKIALQRWAKRWQTQLVSVTLKEELAPQAHSPIGGGWEKGPRQGLGFGRLEIDIFPRIPAKLIGGVQVDPKTKLERLLGLAYRQAGFNGGNRKSPKHVTALAKLMRPPGEEHRFRPLVQPVMTYYTHFEIPRQIELAIQRTF